eukprot:8950631-Pyramimonas_sp.AAC.1
MWYWHLASQQSRLSAGVPDPAAAAKTAAVYAPPGSVDVSLSTALEAAAMRPEGRNAERLEGGAGRTWGEAGSWR